MPTFDDKAQLRQWAPEHNQRAGHALGPSPGRISPQTLRDRVLDTQSSRRGRSLTKAAAVMGPEAITLPRQPSLLFPRGDKQYCSHRSSITIGELNIRTQGRPCYCEIPHSTTFAREWRDTPAEAEWDYSSLNGGHRERQRKVRFAEDVVAETIEVERYLERGSRSKRSTDRSTPEDDDAEIACIELQEAFQLLTHNTDNEKKQIHSPGFADDEDNWLRPCSTEAHLDDGYYSSVIEGLGTLNLGFV